jgi:hypothetical protein
LLGGDDTLTKIEGKAKMHDYLHHFEPSGPHHDVAEYSRRSWVENVPGSTESTWHHELHWRNSNGTEAKLSGNHFFGEVVPAKEGFEVLRIGVNADGPVVYREPVIGWRSVRRHNQEGYGYHAHCVEPLVQDSASVDGSAEVRGILQPDGRVFSGGNWYSDENAFVDATKATWLKKKEELALRQRHKDCPFCADSRRRRLLDDDVPF